MNNVQFRLMESGIHFFGVRIQYYHEPTPLCFTAIYDGGLTLSYTMYGSGKDAPLKSLETGKQVYFPGTLFADKQDRCLLLVCVTESKRLYYEIILAEHVRPEEKDTFETLVDCAPEVSAEAIAELDYNYYYSTLIACPAGKKFYSLLKSNVNSVVSTLAAVTNHSTPLLPTTHSLTQSTVRYVIATSSDLVWIKVTLLDASEATFYVLPDYVENIKSEFAEHENNLLQRDSRFLLQFKRFDKGKIIHIQIMTDEVNRNYGYASEVQLCEKAYLDKDGDKKEWDTKKLLDRLFAGSNTEEE